LTVQVDWPAVPEWLSVQLAPPLKEPLPGLTDQATVPSGNTAVPLLSLSFTVTVQVVGLPISTLPGVQLTVVVVERVFTVTVKALELLPA
jgi:hypothetical protein